MADYKKYFIKTIHSRFGNNAAHIISETEQNYKTISADTKFAATSKNPIDKRLDFSAYFLALIKTLDERGETYETIRTTCLEVVTDYVRPKNKFQAWMKKLPAKLVNLRVTQVFIKWFNSRVSQNPNPDGFVANIITDKKETYGFGYGFDIVECGICKLFNKHKYQKYTSILCEVDKITSALAGLELIRSGTIALGAAKCDFRFKKAKT